MILAYSLIHSILRRFCRRNSLLVTANPPGDIAKAKAINYSLHKFEGNEEQANYLNLSETFAHASFVT